MAKNNRKPTTKSRSIRKAAPRDVVGYSLRDSKNRRVYTGITNNPRARKAEHRVDGKKYSTLQIETEPMTRKKAEEWERNSLKGYQQRTGRLPHYNKTSTGQYETRGSGNQSGWHRYRKK